MESEHRLLSRTEAAALAANLRASGQVVVFTNGCFDLLHAGHIELLERARQLGDVLILGLNTDASVRRLKGAGRPLIDQQDRARVCLALRSVDYVTFFNEDTPLETIRAIRPAVLVKGGDYQIHEVVGRDIVESDQGRVVIIPLVEGKSTTALIRKMTAPDTRETP